VKNTNCEAPLSPSPPRREQHGEENSYSTNKKKHVIKVQITTFVSNSSLDGEDTMEYTL